MSLKRLEKNGEVVLKRFNCNFNVPSYVNPEWLSHHQQHLKTGIVIDLETTGLDRTKDKIIELGVRQFKFDRRTGDIVEVGQSYNGLQDPQIELPKAIADLTGLTDEMLKGQSIDWSKVTEFFSSSDVIIAHNAEFERSFLDREIPQSSSKILACSLKLINWSAKGFSTHKLEILNYYHGFYVDSHRAMNDVDALIYLLSFTDELTTKSYLFELLEAAKQPRAKILVLVLLMSPKICLRTEAIAGMHRTKHGARPCHRALL